MKTSHLHDIWAGPDNNRLVSKQFSFRFPVHIAAKIAALSQLYPQKNRTQLVADLLTAALDDLEKNLPEDYLPFSEREEHDNRQAAEHFEWPYEPSYRVIGTRGDYRNLVNKFYRELEKELGNDNVEEIYPSISVSESHRKDKHR